MTKRKINPQIITEIEVLITCKYVAEHERVLTADILPGTNGLAWQFRGPVYLCGGCKMTTPNVLNKEEL